jgi:hypothetical protein
MRMATTMLGPDGDEAQAINCMLMWHARNK